ncbi:MAG TPA: DUF2961 domain-containing protein, partial [Candidatus Methylacidiphilales bacterium]
MKNHFVLLSMVFFVLPTIPSHADSYTYPQLVSRMTDMRQLAKLPVAGEKTLLVSSYDRRSRYDTATNKYIDWGANADWANGIRKEGEDTVLMDVKGPGCIWRTWAATASKGHWKIYLDGAATPAIDLPCEDYFSGKAAPFNRPNVVYIPSAAAHGFDNYTPIPFQKSCKVVAEKKWGSYYQFTYTQFPTDTVVPIFSMNLSAEDSAALDQADKILGQSGQNPMADLPGAKTDNQSITAGAGGTATVDDLSGAGAITGVKVKLDLLQDPEAQRVLLRQLTISITWDGDTKPAVWSPLGDFFAYVGGADKFQSLPAGLLADGTFYSYWYMPYGQKAHIEVGNDGPAPVAMTWKIDHAPLDQPIESLARFHAKWHRDAFLPERPDRWPDWTLLTTQGTGHYVGTHLHGWTPRIGWWGEGDDKFFIDGEKFPSIFGTGSEDYFGYAWSSAGHFSRPYHNQILNEGNAGHFDDNRWHIADSVPFQTSFEGDIEKYFPNERPTLYAAEAFWYLNAGGSDPYDPVPVADRVGYWVRPVGYIEGERLKPMVKSPHGPVNQDIYLFGKGWCSGRQLFWSPTQAGETTEIELPDQKAGNYTFKAHFGQGPDYGITQLSINGVDVGKPVDLYSPTVAPGDVIELGNVTFPAGKPILKLTP